MSILSERAMLVTLNVTQWSARKLDQKVTNQINSEHNAATDAGRYNKLLVSRDAIKELGRIVGEARAFHYAHTLPWRDGGTRLLPSKAYLDYTAKMQAYRVEFTAAVDLFVGQYPQFVEDARLRLNGLFNESDYPAADDIKSKFSFRVEIDPVPESGDFRVDVGDAQAEQIRADIEARTKDMMAVAVKDTYSRIGEVVGHMAERLRKFQPGTDGKRASGTFHDSLVENVRDLVSLLPALNVTGDSNLERIAARMTALCRDDADALRDNESARASVAAEAEAIMAEVSDFLA
jgi:hypothetical protein